ncbi:hypothetical protein SEEN6907_05251, partial [Salmonella enterica subsp. enterica serovar Newport str. VA_R100506907]
MTFPVEKYGRIFPYCSVKLTACRWLTWTAQPALKNLI